MTGTRGSARDDFLAQLDAAILTTEPAAHQVIDRQLDGLFRCHTNQLRQHTRIQTEKAFILDDLFRAIPTVLVQHFTHTTAPLILHPRLDQINGIDHKGTKRAGHATETKVMHRFENAMHHGACFGGHLVERRARGDARANAAIAPGRVEHLGKVGESQTTSVFIETGKVEENIRLHGGEVREAGDARGLVEEFGPGDFAIGAARRCLSDDQLDEIHLANHVLKGAHIGIGNLAASGNVAEGVKIFEQVVRELVFGRLLDDALKVIGLNEAIVVLVERLKGLSYPLALETTQHLRELGVGEVVATASTAGIERRPFAIPIKRNRLGALVHVIEFCEVVKFDHAGALDVKETKSNLILGIGLCEKVLKGRPIMEGKPTGSFAIGDAKENGILFAFDLVLGRVSSQVPASRRPKTTYIVLALWRNGINKVSQVHICLSSSIVVASAAALKSRFALGTQGCLDLVAALRAQQRLLDRFLHLAQIGLA